MEEIRIFIDGKNDQVRVTCKKCNRYKLLSVALIDDIHRPIVARCQCGYEFTLVFDTRGTYRKLTRASGHYVKVDSDEFSHPIIVEDVSRSGVKFRVADAKHSLAIGDILEISFILKDQNKTDILARIIVRRLDECVVGGEFCALDVAARKAIGFYLMP